MFFYFIYVDNQSPIAYHGVILSTDKICGRFIWKPSFLVCSITDLYLKVPYQHNITQAFVLDYERFLIYIINL
jgi:hypothetical protein